MNTLAISFGLTGLASLWSTMAGALELSRFIPIVLWSGAALSWVWLIVAHLVRGARSTESLISQLRHPAQGPIAAIVPTVGMLLGAELYLVWPIGGFILALTSFVAAIAFAGWILAFWHSGHLNQEAFHGAYLLPTVAAPLVASAVAARLGFPLMAMGAFAVGLFFWVVLVTVLLSRLAFFPPLPDPLTPTLAILLAPPAVAGAAWFAMNGVHDDVVSVSLLGVLAVMFVMQLFLIGVYRRLPFTLGFWSFTFPAASAATFLVQWVELGAFRGWQIVAVVAATCVTVLIAAIGIRSIVLVSSVRRGVRRAEQTLRRADDVAGRAGREEQIDPPRSHPIG
ncbi:SLAC1 family transporter [Herbiconiux daphne]|uniref:Transporter n=1 Tax=Herbiconiux daphne TaxID=2970914 RepID=A0ABT2H7J7_9MICO|nr:transporter [Herbiconiux daphne]MCS5735903.1 transporter [Herbiconiux daphne]